MRSLTRIAFFVAPALMIHATAAQQEPGLTTTREKLDQLIASWRGQPEQTLKDVWGRETSLTQGESTKTYMFERRKRGPNVGLGGVTVVNSGNTVCTAYFQIGLENIVTRTTWRGPDASVCWDLFREYAPPAAE
ncbi:MAG TPA: hypothetical protein VIC71_01360 [Gammaproteobacteria bacterium]|jgi:hypothetical protein